MEMQITSDDVERMHPSTSKPMTWRSIDWDKAKREVKRLQMNIAKLIR